MNVKLGASGGHTARGGPAPTQLLANPVVTGKQFDSLDQES